MTVLEVSKSDLEKIYDALEAAEKHLILRDQMNASIHMAQEARFSPITSVVVAEKERLAGLLGIETGSAGS